MSLPFGPPVLPMLAQLREEIPSGEGWLYEPKWDGFRAIVFRDLDDVRISSRNGQPLERYFPELVAALKDALPRQCIVDGEIVVPGESALDFDALLQRIHPAQSRIQKLSVQTPASFVAFDLLALGPRDLRKQSFHDRRIALEEAVKRTAQVMLAPQTDSARVAKQWFVRFEGAGLDGIVAKRADLPYVEDERVMVKVKHERTADCVIGGYRVHKNGGIGSLLLGLYDENGVLQYVGHTSSFNAKQRKELAERLEPLEGGRSFGEGRAPGGPSRWSQKRETAWNSLMPKLVCEVKFDHLQGDRFRHAAGFLRWRPDKNPRDCTFDQLRPPHPFKLEDVAPQPVRSCAYASSNRRRLSSSSASSAGSSIAALPSVVVQPQPLAFACSAEASTFTVTVAFALCPPSSVTVSVTVKVPAFPYEWLTSTPAALSLPSPKSHAYMNGPRTPSAPPSKVTFSGAVPVDGSALAAACTPVTNQRPFRFSAVAMFPPASQACATKYTRPVQ